MEITRRKRHTAALMSAALGVAVAAVVSGCSSRVDEDPKVDWASDVCDSVRDVGSKLTVPTADSRDAKKYHAEVVTFMDALGRQLGALDAKMRQEGAPPVEGGDAAYKTALANLRNARSSLAGTTAELKKAKVTDEKSLKAALKKAGKGMDQASAYQGPAHDFRADPALKQAFEKAPQCANLPGAGGSAPSAG
ncbi:hypothetical protein OG302_36355 [Streptomyces sp. NBC_01283]|uniref:hypothetical protein n=1 Tax=Streptomyces sp. NBC_01283 TaxID=2903812 RepID=UPI00352D4BF0|nr:hypothetical protein OG302_36355 [Streptomyces sp. NBC_01283]